MLQVLNILKDAIAQPALDNKQNNSADILAKPKIYWTSKQH